MRGNAIQNSNMKAENSNPREAAALARVAEAAREVQAASAAIEARFTAVGERQASALELARLTAAVLELEDARLALVLSSTTAICEGEEEHLLSAEAGMRNECCRGR
jgi:hypothetical protein